MNTIDYDSNSAKTRFLPLSLHLRMNTLSLHRTLDIVFMEDRLRFKEKNGIHNLKLIRRFVMFIIKLMKAYYHRSMKGIRSRIGRNLESELPVILCCLKDIIIR